MIINISLKSIWIRLLFFLYVFWANVKKSILFFFYVFFFCYSVYKIHIIYTTVKQLTSLLLYYIVIKAMITSCKKNEKKKHIKCKQKIFCICSNKKEPILFNGKSSLLLRYMCFGGQRLILQIIYLLKIYNIITSLWNCPLSLACYDKF